MNSKQRVFSNQLDINYNDYNKNKNGIEILKNIKNKNKSQIVNKFYNYNDLFLQTNSYYKLKLSNDCYTTPPTNLYNANISFILKNKDLNHFINKNYNVSECNNKSQILYPYGSYNTNKMCNIYIPYKLDLNKWCMYRNNSTCNIPYNNSKTEYEYMKNKICNDKNNNDRNNNDRNNNDKNNIIDKTFIESVEKYIINNQNGKDKTINENNFKKDRYKNLKPLFI
jgi:hypothetical protein